MIQPAFGRFRVIGEGKEADRTYHDPEVPLPLDSTGMEQAGNGKSLESTRQAVERHSSEAGSQSVTCSFSTTTSHGDARRQSTHGG